jgi:hypothetical protein
VEEVVDLINGWFLDNFEDPVHSVSYIGDNILDHCCSAWNKLNRHALEIMSIRPRDEPSRKRSPKISYRSGNRPATDIAAGADLEQLHLLDQLRSMTALSMRRSRA